MLQGNFRLFLASTTLNSLFIMRKLNGNDTMILDPERKTYDTFKEHKSTSVLGILPNTLTNGFGSCFQVFNPSIEHRFS